MTTNTSFRIAPHVAWQVVGGETVVVDLRNGMAMGLNPTGGMIWMEIGTSGLDRIAAAVATRFGIKADEARKDVDEFVVDLLRRELIVKADV